MSQHAQRTQTGPGRGVILIGWVLTVWALAGAVYLATGISGPAPYAGQNLRLAVGVGLALSLTLMTVVRTVGLMTERETIRRRTERAARTAERAASERARNTGTWRGDGEGQTLTVRYDPPSGRYHVQGWLGDQFLEREVPWVRLLTLRVLLDEFEQNGTLEPVDDEGTHLVRAWLGLAQAEGPTGEPEPVATQPLPLIVPVIRAEGVAALVTPDESIPDLIRDEPPASV